MVLGDAEPLQLSTVNAAAKAAADVLKPTVGGSIAGAILPGAVVGLVDRQRHPFIWWAFGIIPLAWAGSRLVLALTDRK